MSPYRLSKIESTPRLIVAFKDAFNQQDIAAILKLLDPGCVYDHFEPEPVGTISRGTAEIETFFEHFFAAAPGLRLKGEELHAMGRRGILRWQYDWGEASPRFAALRGLMLFREREGRLSEILAYVKGPGP
jgi:ketosteroid isomerase-like protein